MPIREYHCSDCGHDFEVLESFSKTTDECQSCGAGNIERLWSVFAARAGAGKDDYCADMGCASNGCASGGCVMPN